MMMMKMKMKMTMLDGSITTAALLNETQLEESRQGWVDE